MQQIFPDIRCRAVDPRSPPIGLAHGFYGKAMLAIMLLGLLAY